ncbi:MAG TPA: hypothetical protein PLF31_00960 [Candidatus Paceibacterota bacterium]|nr:hypothetical protein [Candidatus Paceibacterota bacterium]
MANDLVKTLDVSVLALPGIVRVVLGVMEMNQDTLTDDVKEQVG